MESGERRAEGGERRAESGERAGFGRSSFSGGGWLFFGYSLHYQKTTTPVVFAAFPSFSALFPALISPPSQSLPRLDGEGSIYFFNILAIVRPISAGLETTCMPHSVMIFIFASAVSSAPPIIAPAWPIRRPGGAV